MLKACFRICLLLATTASCSGSADETADAERSEGATAGATGDCCPQLLASGGALSGAGPVGGESALAAGDAAGAGDGAGGASYLGCPNALWLEAEQAATATAALLASATELSQRVSVACGSLRDELTPEVTIHENAGVEATCTAVATHLDSLDHTDPIVVVEGGQCNVAVDTQIACEKSCSDDCSSTTPLQRCDADSVFGLCDGTCELGSSCEGAAEAPTNCLGVCRGRCSGSCAGECASEANQSDSGESCEGFCDGTCDGTCTGECVISSEGGLDCGANVPCQGACSSWSSSVDCAQPLDHSDDADCPLSDTCYEACAGIAGLTPICDAPSVSIIREFPADVAAALEAYLPPLMRASGGDGPLAQSVAGKVISAASRVSAALDEDPSCLASIGVENLESLAETEEAQATIEEAVSSATLVVESAFGSDQWANLR